MVLHNSLPISDSYNDTTNELIIDCFVSGHPMPSVSWYRQGDSAKPITDSDIYTLITEGSLHRLIISQPNDLRDTGEYLCRIRNDSGAEESRVMVDVNYLLNPMTTENIKKAHIRRLEKENMDRELIAIERRRIRNKELGPSLNLELVRKDLQRKDEEKNRLVIETYLKNTACVEGGTAYFLCAISGKNPEVKWMRNGEELPFNPGRYKIEQRNGVCALQVLRVTMADSGEYSCHLSNNVNTVVSTSQLIVQESRSKKQRKQAPTIPVDLELEGEKGNYMIKYRLTNYHVFFPYFQLSTTVRNTRLILNALL